MISKPFRISNKIKTLCLIGAREHTINKEKERGFQIKDFLFPFLIKRLADFPKITFQKALKYEITNAYSSQPPPNAE